MFAYRGAIVGAWNELPNHVRDLETLNMYLRDHHDNLIALGVFSL